jgi:hypothetical protein
MKGAAALLRLASRFDDALNPEILVFAALLQLLAFVPARLITAISLYRIADGFNCTCTIGSSIN